MNLEELFELPCPANSDLEGKLLGALLVASPSQRSQWLNRIKAPLFFDVFHRWVFEAAAPFMAAGAGDEEILREMVTATSCPVQNCAFELARVFFDSSGRDICGRVREIGYYFAKLKDVAEQRLRILEAEDQLCAAWKEVTADAIS